LSDTSSINVHNIDVGISSNSNNHLDDKDFDECFRNNEEDKVNEVGFSLHDTPTDCLLIFSLWNSMNIIVLYCIFKFFKSCMNFYLNYVF